MFGLRASSKHPHHLKDCCRLPPQLRFSPYILTTGLTSLHMTLSPTANRNHYSCSTGVHRRHAGPTAMCLALELAHSTLTTSKTAADHHTSYDLPLTFLLQGALLYKRPQPPLPIATTTAGPRVFIDDMPDELPCVWP